jgi:hypothetical protein
VVGLRRRLDGWRRPLELVADSPMRLCFRLEEPAESDAWRLRTLLQGVHDPSVLVPVDGEDRPNGAALAGVSTEFLLSSLGQAAQLSPAVDGLLRGDDPGGRLPGRQEGEPAEGSSEEADRFQTQGPLSCSETPMTRHDAGCRRVVRALGRQPRCLVSALAME